MSFEEKLAKLEEENVNIKDVISHKNETGTDWVVCSEDLTDIGPFGGYPIQGSYDTADEAVDAAISILEGGAEVFYISYGW